MNPKTLLKEIKELADEHRGNAVIALILAGISPRNAEKMADGKYKHRIRPSTLRKLSKLKLKSIPSDLL